MNERNIEEPLQPGETPIQIERAMAELQSSRADFMPIVQVFLRSGRTLTNEIQAAIAGQDVDKASFAVHKLKGGAASVFANPIRDAAARLEDLLARRAFAEAEDAIPEIRKLFEELNEFLA